MQTDGGFFVTFLLLGGFFPKKCLAAFPKKEPVISFHERVMTVIMMRIGRESDALWVPSFHVCFCSRLILLFLCENQKNPRRINIWWGSTKVLNCYPGFLGVMISYRNPNIPNQLSAIEMINAYCMVPFDCSIRESSAKCSPEYVSTTLPETNIAPDNGWLEYNRFLLGWPIFRCHVSLRECNFS